MEAAEHLKRISTAYWQSEALFAAVRLDLFRAMGSDAWEVGPLAERIGAAPRGLEPLLRALAALEILDVAGERFRVRPALLALLGGGGPDFAKAVVHHMDRLRENWRRLPEAVRSGASVLPAREIPREELRERTESFMAAMEALASVVAPALVRAAGLRGDERVLDLGCGPGTYFREILRTHPGTTATAVDTRDVIPITRRHVEAEGLGERVTLLEGDFFEVDLPAGAHDVALASNIVHIYGEDQVRTLFRRMHRALRPGGRVLVNDFFTDPTGTRPAWGALFSLNMLLNTVSGKNYTLEQARALLEETGFQEISSRTLGMDATLVAARKPSVPD